jgi:hypothetical protein
VTVVVAPDLFGPQAPVKLRLTRVVTPEDELHAAVAKALTVLVLEPAEWTCFPAGSVPLPPRFSAKLARFGLKRGWPDILVLYGQLYGVELKRAGASLSRTRLARTRSGAWRELIGQEEMFPRLVRAGMADIAVCRSVPEVLAALGAWGVPMRRFAT